MMLFTRRSLLAGAAPAAHSPPSAHRFRRRLFLQIAPFIAGAVQLAHAASPQPLVLGQSLNLGATTDGTSRRVDSAVKSYLARVNAAGGIKGRRIKLVTLNDEGDPKRHGDNLKSLVLEHGAVALLNCQDEASCSVAMSLTEELRVPMVGAISGGALGLARTSAPWLFRIRPGYAREGAVLAKTLRSTASTRVAVVTDTPKSELTKAVTSGLAQESLEYQVLVVQPEPLSASALLATLEKHQFHAAVLVLNLETLEWLIDKKFTEGLQWPRVLAATSTTNQVAMMSAFKSRMFGFTAVVPNPEMQDRRLTREFAQDLAKYGAEFASTFTGLEGYISAVVAVEALKRADLKSHDGVVQALRQLKNFDLGGFVVSFDRDTGSSWVDVGVRSREGNLLR